MENSLFGDESNEFLTPKSICSDKSSPLSARMRPSTLEEYKGQDHIVGPGTILRQAIETDQLPSAIFWGPPGSGKSTLAHIIASRTKAVFENYSAVTSGVQEIRKVIETARERRSKTGKRTILFIDEIHRWNKSQQDALLPCVEDGTVILIGATTENPYFEINSPLLSRSRIFQFNLLDNQAISELLYRSVKDKDRGLGPLELEIDTDAVNHLADISNGDARTALNALETAAQFAVTQNVDKRITLKMVEDACQQRMLKYDKKSDEHYDTISAFIKSVRGSAPDAAIYWLAKMLEAGEDPKFIARRLVILASEDIGNADPQALLIANAAANAVLFIGMPEAQLTLSQATAYLATAPKSNAANIAIGRARQLIRENGAAPVPLYLRDSHYPGAKILGNGQDYKYPHDFPGNWVEQVYVSESALSQPLYVPTNNGYEQTISRGVAYQPAVLEIIPEINTVDLQKSIEFYKILGFQVSTSLKESAVMTSGYCHIRILLVGSTGEIVPTRLAIVVSHIEKVKTLQAGLQVNLSSQSLELADPDGNILHIRSS